jgi:hypothetical protein
MRIAIAILLAVLPFSSFAQCESWTADIRFKIEGANYRETLSWIGGWSAAIDSINANSKELSICTPECAYLISKEIVDILNIKFEGQTISAEIAAAEIWPVLKTRLLCSKTGSPKKRLNYTIP